MNFDLLHQFTLTDAARAFAAFVTCCALGLIFGSSAIAWLKRHFREPIKSISPTVVRMHLHKSQTPTMGGLFIVVGVVLGTCMFADVRDQHIAMAMATLIAFAALGAIDDLIKLRTDRRGLSAKAKLFGQFIVALSIGLLLDASWNRPDWLTLAKNALVFVVAANAVNLTDGLDGLAGGCGLIASAAITVILLVVSAAELAIVSSALAGSLAAFVWFNRHPARVFMGDTGSQAIGALLGYLAIASNNVWLFAIIGGVFLIEAASVALQLTSYKARGKRLFLCAPLHHHFQFAGWAEPSIVRMFCAASFVCAIVAITLTPPLFSARFTNKSRSDGGNLSTGSRVQASAIDPSRSLGTLPVLAQQERNLR